MTQTNNQPPIAITANDIAQDFEQLIANSSSLPVSVPPVLPSVQSVSLSPPSAQSVLLSAVSQTDILSNFQTLVSVQPVPSSVGSVFFTPQHSLDGFANWLRSEKLTHASIKNYLSDVRQFLAFAQTTNSPFPLQPPTPPQSPSLSKRGYPQGGELEKAITNFIHHLQQQDAPQATINRKLAAIRKYCIFMNQTLSIPNLPPDPTHQLLKSFKAHLVKKRHSQKTITNYLSDLRHYLKWSEKSTPPSPSLAKRGIRGGVIRRGNENEKL